MCASQFFLGLSSLSLFRHSHPYVGAATMEGRTSRRVIGAMREDTLHKVLKWAGELGWNPGQRDAAPFRVADRDGFFSVSDDDDGAVMAGGRVETLEHRLARIHYMFL